MNQVRFGLLATFLLCLTSQLIAFFTVAHKMWPDELQSLVLKLLAIYSIHLSVILGGIFAQPSGPLEDPPLSLAWTAIVLAVLWNILLMWRSLSFSMATKDSVGDLIKYLEGIASSSSFLVTGALAFFFTKGTQSVRPTISGNEANSGRGADH
jgi:hypothetical protein